MPTPTDTPPEIGRRVADIYRRMPLLRKWQILGETFAVARMLHAAGVRLRDAGATTASIDERWLATSFGYHGQVPQGGEVMDGSNQNLTVLRDVLRVLTQLGITHALGGSMACSLYGVARFTRGADVTVEPFPGKEDAFAAAFGPDYYLSLPAVRQAVAQRSSFKVLHTREGFKVDLFVRKDQPFEESAMKRRVVLALPDVPPEPVAVLCLRRLARYAGCAANFEDHWTMPFEQGNKRRLIFLSNEAFEKFAVARVLVHLFAGNQADLPQDSPKR